MRSVDQSGASSSGVIALSADDSGAISASVLASPELATIRAAARRDQEEESLIARCLQGDVEAFRPLVQRYQRLAFSVALRMLGSRADAEDIAQQAFVDAFNALERFDGDGRHHAFSTWLLRIAVNRSKDVLKSKRRTEEPLDHDVGGGEAAFAYDPSTPEANAFSGESRERLEKALLALPTKYREVLVLKDAEDLSYDEIRGILQLPITTLKIRVVRARAMLREAIESQGLTASGRQDDAVSRTIQGGPGVGDLTEQPIQELSALRDVKPPPALVARVMTQLAEPRQLSIWRWLRRPFPIEIRLSPLAIICLALGLGALFVLIGATMH